MDFQEGPQARRVLPSTHHVRAAAPSLPDGAGTAGACSEWPRPEPLSGPDRLRTGRHPPFRPEWVIRSRFRRLPCDDPWTNPRPSARAWGHRHTG